MINDRVLITILYFAIRKSILTAGPNITTDDIDVLEDDTMVSITNLCKEDLDRLNIGIRVED